LRTLFGLIAFAVLLSATPAFAAADDVACHQARGELNPFIFLFPKDKTTLSKDQKEELKDIAWRGKYKLGICVVGQADKEGDADYNYKLAKKRAAKVADLLVEYGVPETIITVRVRGEAFGDSLFESWEPSRQDRRVEVVFLE